MVFLRTKRHWAYSAIAVALLALFVWSRAVASWAPQRIEPGVQFTADFIPFFMGDSSQGCWLRYRPDRIKNVETGRELDVPTFCARDGIRFSPDGRSFVATIGVNAQANTHSRVEWYDATTGQLRRSFGKSGAVSKPPRDVQFSTDGKRLLVLADNAVQSFPLDGSLPQNYRFLGVQGDCLSPGGAYLLAQIHLRKVQASSYQLNIYDVGGQRLLHELKLKEGYAQDWMFSPDEKLLAFTSDSELGNSLTSVFDVQSGKRLWRSNSNLLGFSHDSHSLLVWSSFDEIAVRDARSGEVVRRVTLPDEMRGLSLSADSNFLYGLSSGDSLWKMRLR